MKGRLRRARRGRVLAGLCAGLARWLDWKPWVVRAVFVVGSVIPVLPGFVIYAVLWLFVPLEDAAGQPADDLPHSV